MKRKMINSSVISEVGYDSKSSILEVKFKDTGDIYRYYKFPKSKYAGLMKAKSKGYYFNKNIRLIFGSVKQK